MLMCFAIPLSSGPHFVRTLHHGPTVLGGPHNMTHSFIELHKAVVYMISLVSCDCGFHSIFPLIVGDRRFLEASCWDGLTVGKAG